MEGVIIMADITVLILTKNEELNLKECLESIAGFAKRVVVVDSGSEDNTTTIAQKYGADVFNNPWINYAKQFTWGLENTNIDTKWTMRLDADERLTPALIAELEELLKIHDNDHVNGITMEAWLFFMGRKLKYGGPQKRKLMVFKTGIGKIEDREMDEHTFITEGISISSKEKFLHYDFKNLTFYIDKLNGYATREMKDYVNFITNEDSDQNLNDKTINATRNKKFGIYYKFPKFFRSILLFIYVYIFRLGFLDGKEGFLYHFLYSCFYRILVDGKISEYEKIKDGEINGI